MALSGLALAGRSIPALGLTALYWSVTAHYLRIEEEFLATVNGERDRRYRSATPRFVRPPVGGDLFGAVARPSTSATPRPSSPPDLSSTSMAVPPPPTRTGWS